MVAPRRPAEAGLLVPTVPALVAPARAALPPAANTAVRIWRPPREPTPSMFIWLDELEMPARPEVEPTPTDREVFVDPLPDDIELEDWLTAFGEVEEVARLPPVDGMPSEKGYVLFKKHASAKACVETRAGVWSESERALSLQYSQRRLLVKTYPDSMVSAWIGRKGEEINKLRTQAGLWKLAVKGKDIAPDPSDKGQGKGENPDDPVRQRLHFFAEGVPDSILRFRTELERRLGEIHLEISTRILELGDEWVKDQKKQLRKYRRHLKGEVFGWRTKTRSYGDGSSNPRQAHISRRTLKLIRLRQEAKDRGDKAEFARLNTEVKRSARRDKDREKWRKANDGADQAKEEEAGEDGGEGGPEEGHEEGQDVEGEGAGLDVDDLLLFDEEYEEAGGEGADELAGEDEAEAGAVAETPSVDEWKGKRQRKGHGGWKRGGRGGDAGDDGGGWKRGGRGGGWGQAQDSGEQSGYGKRKWGQDDGGGGGRSFSSGAAGWHQEANEKRYRGGGGGW